MHASLLGSRDAASRGKGILRAEGFPIEISGGKNRKGARRAIRDNSKIPRQGGPGAVGAEHGAWPEKQPGLVTKGRRGKKPPQTRRSPRAKGGSKMEEVTVSTLL